MALEQIPAVLRRYLWKGLDLERFEVLAIVPQSNGHATVIMHEVAEGPMPWCVEYRGCGRYFASMEALRDYCQKRWGFSPELF